MKMKKVRTRTLLRKLLMHVASLRLTVMLLFMAALIVVVGTVVQAEIGIYLSHKIFFSSFFLWREIYGVNIPVLPAGYSIGLALFLNLSAALIVRFRFSRYYFGLIFIHGGLLVLVLGQFMIDRYSVESQLRLREGETKGYSESIHQFDLVIILPEHGGSKVYSFPFDAIESGHALEVEGAPIQLLVVQTWKNSLISPSASGSSKTLRGQGANYQVTGMPSATRLDKQNIPSALVQVIDVDSKENLGLYLLSAYFSNRDVVETGDHRKVSIALQRERYYSNSLLRLDDFIHERHQGSDKSKAFESQLSILSIDGELLRKANVYMNNPLRLGSSTYYQASYTPDEQSTILHVVENPFRSLPYWACIFIAFGLVWQLFASRVKPKEQVDDIL